MSNRPLGPERVRGATAADVGRLAELLHAFNVEFDAPSPGVDVLEGRLSRLSGSEAMFVLVADEPDGGHLVGLAVVSLRPNVWYDGPVALLDELYVAPERRNRGIGTALLAAARTQAGRRGAELMEINVDEGDVDAQRFYERHGFTQIEPTTGEVARYYWGPTA